MTPHLQLIEGLGGPHKLAHLLTEAGFAVKPVTARAWAIRGRIPAKYWTPAIEAGAAAGVHVSASDLAADLSQRLATSSQDIRPGGCADGPLMAAGASSSLDPAPAAGRPREAAATLSTRADWKVA